MSGFGELYSQGPALLSGFRELDSQGPALLSGFSELYSQRPALLSGFRELDSKGPAHACESRGWYYSQRQAPLCESGSCTVRGQHPFVVLAGCTVKAHTSVQVRGGGGGGCTVKCQHPLKVQWNRTVKGQHPHADPWNRSHGPVPLCGSRKLCIGQY